MKHFMKLMLVSGMLAALAGVSSAHEVDGSPNHDGAWDQRGHREDRQDLDRGRRDRADQRWNRGERRTERRWDRREARQERRIHRGMRQGEITRGEALRLRMLDRRIDMMQRRAWADGHLSLRERAMIRRMMQREGRTIGRFNHNQRSY